MNHLSAIFGHIGGTLLLLVRSLKFAGTLPRQHARFFEQCYLIGYTSLPIVTILSFFIGSVLALQSGYSMQNFGAKQFIGTLVGLSMVRELGPVMVAILVAGRVGSAITAELASMKVYQEIDALVTMNIPPERFLVLPRLIAVLLFMPALTMVGIIVGWLGGAVVCHYVSFIGLEPEQYFRSLRAFLDARDLLDGLIKGEIFGFFVILTACNIGLRTQGGPREIGHAVTRSVVTSLILIVVLDYFITKALA